MLTRRYGLQELENVYLEESVAMFLEEVDKNRTVRDIVARYQQSLNVVKRKIDDVLSALLKFAADTLKSQECEFTRVKYCFEE